MAVEDAASGAVFSGDGAGIVYPSLWLWRLAGLPLPNTTPPHFDPDTMVASLERLRARRPERLYVTHFGPAATVDRFLAEGAAAVRAWRGIGLVAASLDETRVALRASIDASPRAAGVHDVAADLELDLDLNNQGPWPCRECRERRRSAAPRARADGAPRPRALAGRPRGAHAAQEVVSMGPRVDPWRV